MKTGPAQPRRETVEGKHYRYTAIFTPAEEGGYVVTVPTLDGITTEGDSLEEARTMVKEAIVGYLELLQKRGEEIPVEQTPGFSEPVDVTLSRA